MVKVGRTEHRTSPTSFPPFYCLCFHFLFPLIGIQYTLYTLMTTIPVVSDFSMDFPRTDQQDFNISGTPLLQEIYTRRFMWQWQAAHVTCTYALTIRMFLLSTYILQYSCMSDSFYFSPIVKSPCLNQSMNNNHNLLCMTNREPVWETP